MSLERNGLSKIKTDLKLIVKLAKNDFTTKYAGSYLGILWAFVQPVITILLYWFVFQFGLRAVSPVQEVPFIVWLITGMIPWLFFAEALLNATNCMLEYSYLVKKVVFKIGLLPIIKATSALFVHVVFLLFLLFVCSVYQLSFSLYTLQVLYYSFCVFFLALAISYMTSAIIVFFKDLGQIINIILQIGMWATPIMWSYTMIPAQYQWIAKLNPVYYLVEGFRDTFIYHVWFWERTMQTIYFWGVSAILFVIGIIVFKKVKPHFADVL